MQNTFSVRYKIILFIIVPAFLTLLMTGVVNYYVSKGMIQGDLDQKFDISLTMLKNIIDISYQHSLEELTSNISVLKDEYDKKVALDSADKIMVEVVNQITKERQTIEIPDMKYNDVSVYKNNSMVDKYSDFFKSSITIFQKIDGGLLRISTTILGSDGNRAINTFIPSDSEVYRTILNKSSFQGRAFVVDDYYLTFYIPLYDINGILVGALYAGMPQTNMEILRDKIDSFKIGKSGYAQIIDGTGKQIIHPDAALVGTMRVSEQHKKMIEMKKGTLIGKQEASLNNNRGKVNIYRFTYFEPLDWIVIVSVNSDEFYSQLRFLLKILLAILIIALIVAIILTFSVTRSIVSKLVSIADALFNISEGEGNLSLRINQKGRDETGRIAGYFNKFLDKLTEIIRNLKQVGIQSRSIGAELVSSTQDVSSTIEEMAATMNNMKERFSLLNNEIVGSKDAILDINNYIENVNKEIVIQSDRIEDSSSAIEEMSASLTNILQVTEEKKKFTDDLAKMAEVGQRDMNVTLSSIKDISKSGESISAMIGIINDLADRTNLLAMNAAIEAAHAGDSGRGFAVVADEIRKLSEKTKSGSKEISDILNKITEKIKNSSGSSENTEKMINQMISQILEVSASMNEMLNATKEITTGAKQIIGSLGKLKEITGKVKTNSLNLHEKSEHVETSIININQLSDENLVSINEIANGTNDISRAIIKIKDLSEHNEEHIKELESEINRFTVDVEKS